MSSASIRTLALLAAGAVGLLTQGCGPSEAPQTIEGKAPAEYREEIENKAAHPLGPPPAKGKGAPAGKNSKAQSR